MAFCSPSTQVAGLSKGQLADKIESSLGTLDLDGKRVLLIVPDSTRTAPIGPIFAALHDTIANRVAALDVMIALGTHPPMSEQAICERLEISPAQRAAKYAQVAFLNHEWDNPDALVKVGTITAEEIRELSDGLFALDVDVTINKAALEYDHMIIVGPVYPHEVVGFSGGSKYLFPGISGPELLNFFHWLGAVISTPRIIGTAWTPVRQVIERAAEMVPTPCHAFCLVVVDGVLVELFFGTPPEAWRLAAEQSAKHHIVLKPKPFHTVLAIAPLMYDEMWVGGKCMYKLEPVVADGGELIIYAPHIKQLSQVHGAHIERIGYHVRDYFLKQWDRFKDEPWGILAHSTHVRGIGTYEDGVESPRIRVTLATGIPEEMCTRVNLGYRSPDSLDLTSFHNREDKGVLVVPHAGETLYELEQRPNWARPRAEG